MATATYWKEGDNLAWTNGTGSAVAVGEIVPLKGRVFVAADAIAATADGTLYSKGAFSFPAVNTEAFAFGDRLYWNAGTGKVQKTVTITYAGVCVEAKLQAGTTAKVVIGPASLGDPAVAAAASFTIGAEDTNVINVAIQLKDAAGNDIAYKACVQIYLSDDSAGDGLIATATSGNVAIGTDGTVINSYTAKKHLLVQSEADGDIDFNITESGAKTLYMVVVLPSGALAVSGAVTFAS